MSTITISGHSITAFTTAPVHGFFAPGGSWISSQAMAVGRFSIIGARTRRCYTSARLKVERKMNGVSLTILIKSAVFLAVTMFSLAALGSERAARRAFHEAKSDPVELRRFLYAMPKGGDLHNHLDGAIYAENFINWAAEDGKCVDLKTLAILEPPCDVGAQRPPVADIRDDGDRVNRLVDAFSVRNYGRREVSGHNQFFSTFARFAGAAAGREGDMLAEASARAARQNMPYLELMQSYGMFKAQFLANDSERFDPSQPVQQLLDSPTISELVNDTVNRLNAIEARWRTVLDCGGPKADAGCGVTVRYLAQVIRTRPRRQVLAQTVLAARLIAADDRYVGLNFVAPEDHPITLRDHRWQMEQIAAATATLPADQRRITLHAGELALGLVPPEHLGKHVREALEIAGARRIGHGVDIVHDPAYPELMTWMAANGIAVEINLTSNDVILGIKNDRHPFQSYRKYGVPLTLSTDDEGVSRIDLTHEYRRAVETYGLNYPDVKQLSRNALSYSFLPGDNLFADPAAARAVDSCRRALASGSGPEGDCGAFLNRSEKARLQWDLERRFRVFEATFQ